VEQLSARLGIDLHDLRIEMIESGLTVDQARARVLDVIYTAKPVDGHRPTVIITQEERDKSKSAAVDGIMLRAGIATDEVGDAQTEYQTMSMLELAKDRLRIANKSTRGLDQMGIFQRALTTSDFTNILADVANKAMLDGFANAEESYEEWADTTGRVNDFKTHVFARASEAPSLVEINPDGGEYQYGAMADAKESVAVVDYGIIVPFTRKAMVNDDLGALTDVREKLGAASKRKYGDLGYSVLTTNAAMGDGIALFEASSHGNYVASGAVPSVSALQTAFKAMATQTDINGIQNLNVRPVYALSPWALKGTWDQLLINTYPIVPGSSGTPAVNPYAYLKAVYDSRLDADEAAGWYLAARKGMTVRLFTLNGNMTPMMETREGWAVDGMEFKCRVTAAAKAMDYRGLYFNEGD
ncbi:MAG: hypothetical protein V2I40_06685, partial [Desulfobacteraceae bacterium]|jgi:hypothetical protein|nr:hypothetical protein [Desulfobacteraceae bacterium]